MSAQPASGEAVYYTSAARKRRLAQDRKCVHCGDWIKPDRLRRYPETPACGDCWLELKLRRGTV